MSRRRKVVELKAFSGIRRMVSVVVVVMVKRRTAMVAESQAISTRIDKKGGKKNQGNTRKPPKIKKFWCAFRKGQPGEKCFLTPATN